LSYTILSLLIGSVLSVQPSGTFSLYRYFSGTYSDHLYTTDWTELPNGGANTYSYEKVLGYLYTTQQTGTTPLYRYYSSGGTDSFYTANWSELGNGAYGYAYIGIIGYLYATQQTGTIPIYRYYNGGSSDHFYTVDWSELGNGASGYSYENIVGYIYPATCSTTADCGSGLTCSSGKCTNSDVCTSSCASGYTCCNGFCVTLSTDPFSCGSTCKTPQAKCTVDSNCPSFYFHNAVVTYTQPAACSNGRCIIPCDPNGYAMRCPGTLNSQCTNDICQGQLGSNNWHDVDGNQNSSPAVNDPYYAVCCSGTAVDISADIHNCGSCGHDCGTPPSGCTYSCDRFSNPPACSLSCF